MINLDDLEAKRAAATEGDWAIWRDLDHQGFYTVGDADSYQQIQDRGETEECNPTAHVYTEPDAAWIVAITNAAPELLAEVRRLREENEGLRGEVGVLDGAYTEAQAEVRELRAAVALLNQEIAECDVLELRAKVQRVEALAERWEASSARPLDNPALDWEALHARALRAALAGDES